MMFVCKMMEFIKEFVLILSLIGNIYEVINYIESFLKEWKVEMVWNYKGGLIVMFFGCDIFWYCMLMVYVDIFGVMVKEIKVDGRLIIDLIGGFCYNLIEGEYC